MELGDIIQNRVYDSTQDESVIDYYDTRKTRLTLEQINHFRRIKETKKFDEVQKLKRVQVQYKDDLGGI